MNRNPAYDCIIVGGGAAGLSAALAMGRARRRVLVCSTGSPRNAPAHASHNFFTRDGASPLELLRIAREQLGPYRTVEFQEVGVQGIQKSGAGFEVALEGGAVQSARKILLAFGVRDEFPDIEGFGAFWGQSVFHCPFCHGYEVRDEPLAVVGSGEVGVEMVALLRSWSADLVLCTNGAGELSPAQRELLARHGVPVREEKIIRFEGAGGQLESIVFESGEPLARRGMLIRLRQKLRCDLAESVGCERDEAGFVRVSPVQETSVPGVYAAGDITSPMQTVATAVAQGTVAVGGGINRALIKEDFA